MLHPIVALPAPSAFPCALLGVAGVASSPGTAGPLPLESSSLWHPLSGRDLPFPNPSGAQCHSLRMSCLQWAFTHLFQTVELPSSGNPSAFKTLSESWAEDVLPDCWGQLRSTPRGCLGLWGSSLA